MLIWVSPASAVPVTIVTPGVSLTKSCAFWTPVRARVSAVMTVTDAGTFSKDSVLPRAVTMISPGWSAASVCAPAPVALSAASETPSNMIAMLVLDHDEAPYVVFWLVQ